MIELALEAWNAFDMRMNSMSKRWAMTCVFSAFISTFQLSIIADGPTDNRTDTARPIPPLGTPLNPDQQAVLEKEVASLKQDIGRAKRKLKDRPELLQRFSDIEVFSRAVETAITYNEIFAPEKEFQQAEEQLAVARERLQQLLGETPQWLQQTGLVPRGYRSKIDDSIQPYGLVIPSTWRPGTSASHRLDIWFHGRGEKLTELSFLNQRLHNAGQFTPDDTIVLHLYGRYCNANKFAGEIDLFEALDHVRQDYQIDENRIIVRGFSMGGAACWQFATHYAGLWAAAAPGAGFSETKEFLEFFQKETLKPYWWEVKLWNLYDATVYAENLFQCPTVAYSGAIDRQKQAADIMERFLEREGLAMTHIIGPDTAHRYHPDAKVEIDKRIDSIAAIGRNPVPNKIRFTTYTLRYHKMNWIELTGLESHWDRARIEAEIISDHALSIATTNIASFTIHMESGQCPLDVSKSPVLSIDGQKVVANRVLTDRSWNVQLTRENGTWKLASPHTPDVLKKRPGLQGPIDDAFMDRFLMVGPGSWPMNTEVGAWVSKEMSHSLQHWRQQFRGEPRFKLDKDITARDIAESNLILWGDPASNSLIRKIASQLPIRWDHQGLHTPEKNYPTERYLPAMIFPNPLNPSKYVVINSGFTYREYDYLNNARQVPKLPDWAILDISVPASTRWPAGIAEAGFFGEKWEWKGTRP